MKPTSHLSRRWATSALALLAACGPGGDDGDSCPAVLPGDLVITEIFADADAPDGSSGADEGKEWIEIYNASDAPIDLAGLELRHGRPDGTATKVHALRSVTIAPGAYLVLGNVLDELKPGYVDYGFGADLGDLFNTGDGLVTIGCGSNVVDDATYSEITTGASRQFDGSAAPDYTANDNLLAWCDATAAGSTEFDPLNFGTPGEVNQDCDVVVPGMCTELDGTMRATVAPMIGDLVLTEIMPSPDAILDDTVDPPVKVSDDDAEWIEIETFADFDLNGISLDRANDSRDPDVVDSGSCLHVTAGSRIVFARSADGAVNGMLGSVAGTFGFTMVGGSAASPGDVQILIDDLVLDSFTWTSAVATGASLQLDPDFVTPGDNDMERFWCDGTTAYGLGDLGTPGQPNLECEILPPAGFCVGVDLIERPIVAPAAGQLVISEYLANPIGDDGDEEWFEITNTGGAAFDLNGLQLDRAGDAAAAQSIDSAACVSVAPAGYAVFAHTAEPITGLPDGVVAATFTFSMVDAGDIQVLAADDTVLDAISWLNAPSNLSRQLSSDALDATLNDVDDGTGVAGSTTDPDYCDGVGTYGPTANTGTPGAANATCP